MKRTAKVSHREKPLVIVAPDPAEVAHKLARRKQRGTFAASKHKAAMDVIGIEKVCRMVAAGYSVYRIAKAAGIDFVEAYAWLHEDPDRTKMWRVAQAAGAEAHVEQAEGLIEEADTALALDKAKALGQHLRWKAAKYAPTRFADKIDLAVDDKRSLPDDQLLARITVLARRAAIQLPAGAGEGGDQAPEGEGAGGAVPLRLGG